MSIFKRFTLITMLIAALFSMSLFATAQDDEQAAPPDELLAAVTESEMFADWLPNYPNYQFNASGPDEDGIWYVEFYDEPWEEWLGYANIHENTFEITESSAPKPLSPEDYDAQLALIQQYVIADSEVLGWLNNVPNLWDVYPDWNRWEQRWDIGFYRGIQGVVVYASVDENGDVYLQDILDPNILDEEEAREEARNQAINLAYGAEGADAALEGYDEWTTYVEQQGDGMWSVSFVSGESVLLFVLVDVEQDVIVSAE